MIPKKYKQILNQCIQDNNMDDAFTRDANEFFWQEVRKNLSSIKDLRVAVQSLGVFSLMENKINKYIHICNGFLRKYKGYQTGQKYYRKEFIRGTLEHLLKLKGEFEKERKRKVAHVKKRKVDSRKKNTGGDQKQPL